MGVIGSLTAANRDPVVRIDEVIVATSGKDAAGAVAAGRDEIFARPTLNHVASIAAVQGGGHIPRDRTAEPDFIGAFAAVDKHAIKVIAIDRAVDRFRNQ